MTKTYGLYRYFYTEKGNRYSPFYYLSKQFADLAQAGFVNIEDNIVPEDLYSGEIAPGVITMRRFIKCFYDETNITDFNSILNNVSGMNDIVQFDTLEEARQWVRDNVTYISEDTPGTFLLVEEYENEMGEVVPAKYLIIS